MQRMKIITAAHWQTPARHVRLCISFSCCTSSSRSFAKQSRFPELISPCLWMCPAPAFRDLLSTTNNSIRWLTIVNSTLRSLALKNGRIVVSGTRGYETHPFRSTDGRNKTHCKRWKNSFGMPEDLRHDPRNYLQHLIRKSGPFPWQLTDELQISIAYFPENCSKNN